MAREAGLAPALVKRRVPELAETVMAALPTIKIVHPASEKVAALIHQRSENVLNRTSEKTSVRRRPRKRQLGS